MREIRPYLRGLNALSPSDGDVNALEETNHLDHGFSLENETAFFRCDTVRNISTLHPQTCAFVFEIEADPDATVELRVNGKSRCDALRSLLQTGYADQMKPWHSHAFKMHTAYARSACRTSLRFRDTRETPWDVYQAEVVQCNGSRAFISPIFVL